VKSYPDIIVQARMSSTRLPGKVLKPILGKPMLFFLIERLKRVNYKDRIIIACSNNELDNSIINFCKKEKILFFRGSEDNVLQRFYQASKYYKIKNIVRITSDCPLIDPEIIDDVIFKFLNLSKIDYVSNTIKPTYPLGMSVEVFTENALQKAVAIAKENFELEHVTPVFYMKKNFFNINSIISNKNQSEIRLTVDTKEDYNLIKIIYKKLYKKKIDFGLDDILHLLENNPELTKINNHIKQIKLRS
tara:strand:+ start:15415 stop:16155 length:741 start_codon:yes stop_codon:yes gene_type:complete